MNNLKVITMASALIVVAACEPSNNTAQPTQPTQPTKTSQNETQSSQPANGWVWPGTAEQAVVDPNLTKSNYMIVYDGSGSMGDKACGGSQPKHNEGQIAVKAFVDAIPDNANIGFYAFDNNFKGVRVGLGSGNKDNIITAIDDVKTGNGTPLKSAVRSGYDALTLQGQRQLGYGRYALVIVTDGAASLGENPSELVNTIINNTPVEIHTVGFCLGDNHSLNQPGRTFYASATSSAEVLKSLEGVLAEAQDADVTDFSD